MPSRSEFLESYNLPLEAEHNFSVDGNPASWALGHPKEWGLQNDDIELPAGLLGSDRAYSNLYTAISSDKKLLAISSSQERIVIYDIESKEPRQELEGTGHIAFRPTPAPAEQDTTSGEEEEVSGYTLISSVSIKAERGAEKNTLVLWELDRHGRLVVEEEVLDTSVFATKAIDSIKADLAEHEWSDSFIASSSLYEDFNAALAKVATQHRRRHNTVLDDARLANYSISPFSADGKKLLFHLKNNTTQHGMREPEELPRVVVWDVDAGKEIHHLTGHKDKIMWSSFSPDQFHIASVAWDGSLRMYDAVNGEFLWTQTNSPGQAWAGAFTPDSKHVIWSSNNGRTVQVLRVDDGRLISTFAKDDLKDWCRNLRWHPDGQQIALCAGRRAYIWRPFEGDHGEVTQSYEIKADSEWRSFVSIRSLDWLADGHKAAINLSDGSILVWDTDTNEEQLFRRPKGTQVAWTDHGLYEITIDGGEQDYYLSVDGDGTVRIWKYNLPPPLRWWEEKNPEVKLAKAKVKYPETGKYVKVNKPATKDETEEKKDRNIWAGWGADLWTAE